MAPPVAKHSRRISTPVLIGLLVVLVAALAVQLTRTGIDLFVLLVAGFMLLVVERTLGDYIAESLGPAGTALVFATVAALSVAYSLTDTGKAQAGRFFAAAEAQGYKPLWFKADNRDDARTAGFVSKVTHAADGSTGASSPPPYLPPANSPDPGSSPAPMLPPPPGAATPPSASSSSGTGAVPTAAPTTGWLRRPPAPTGVPRVTADPDLVNQGETVTLRFAVSGDMTVLPPEVAFRINDRHLATVRVNEHGTAEAKFVPAVAGTYVVRVDVPGRGYSDGSLGASVTVLPGRR